MTVAKAPAAASRSSAGADDPPRGVGAVRRRPRLAGAGGDGRHRRGEQHVGDLPVEVAQRLLAVADRRGAAERPGAEARSDDPHLTTMITQNDSTARPSHRWRGGAIGHWSYLGSEAPGRPGRRARPRRATPRTAGEGSSRRTPSAWLAFTSAATPKPSTRRSPAMSMTSSGHRAVAAVDRPRARRRRVVDEVAVELKARAAARQRA